MNTATIISALDNGLHKAGENVVLRRRIGESMTAFVSVALRARLRGYDASELTEQIRQSDSHFIFGPTEINAKIADTTWPGDAGGGVLPKIGDFLSQGGQDRKIEAIQPIRIGDTIVRFEGRVRG